jgi:hypothetical protein
VIPIVAVVSSFAMRPCLCLCPDFAAENTSGILAVDLAIAVSLLFQKVPADLDVPAVAGTQAVAGSLTLQYNVFLLLPTSLLLFSYRHLVNGSKC